VHRISLIDSVRTDSTDLRGEATRTEAFTEKDALGQESAGLKGGLCSLRQLDRFNTIQICTEVHNDGEERSSLTIGIYLTCFLSSRATKEGLRHREDCIRVYEVCAGKRYRLYPYRLLRATIPVSNDWLDTGRAAALTRGSALGMQVPLRVLLV
jgi:hypothetical protein